ncbi:MAG TPA: MFS transporter [Anaerolineae bacterium]
MNFLRRLRKLLLTSRPARFVGQFSHNAQLFLLSTLIGGITLAGFNLFFNIYLRSRGFDLDFIGVLNAIPAASALIVGVPMGILSDRIGRRRAMLIGLGTAILGAWGVVTADTRVTMLLMSGVMGIANSLYYLSMAPFMMRASGDKERTLLFSLNFGLMTISGAVGNLIAGQLPAWFAHGLGVGAESPEAYQAVLLASVWGGGMGLIPIWLIREGQRPDPRQAPPIGFADFRRLLRRSVLRMAVPNFVIGLGAATLIPYLNLFFKGRFQIDDGSLGVLFSLSAMLTGVATIVGPRIAERLGGKIKAVVFTQGTSIAFLLIMGFSPFFLLSGAAFLVRAALMNMSTPLYSAFTMEQTPEHERGAVNSMLQLMWEVGWTVGPYLSGVVQARYGFGPLFISTAVLYCLAIGLTWLFFRNAEAQAKSAAAVA